MKRFIPILLAVSMLLALTACDAFDNWTDGEIDALSIEDADATLATWIQRINPSTNSHEVDLDTSTSFVSELPDINAAFQFSVRGNNQVNIEVWASTERSGEGNDGWINRVTENFNRANITNAAGQTVSVSIRAIDAGAQLDYLTLSDIRPDAWSPANGLWHEMALSKGVNSVMALERTVGNTAGILMQRSTYDDYMGRHNNQLKLDELIDDVIAENLVLGFTNPYTSDTALNMLTQVLLAMDHDNPLSAENADRFQAFQAFAPPPAYTTAQMRESAKRGFISVMVMERQAYANEPSLADFVFTPFGVRHDNPVYKFEDTTPQTSEILDLWFDFITNSESQTLGTQMGFNEFDDYSYDGREFTGIELYAAQALWKANKSGGRPTVAVFVADTSGSMHGNRIHALRESLLNSMQYIGEDAEIGLVSYSDQVTIELPIAPFEGAHRGRFQSAVKSLHAAGGTHTYSATLVGINMIREHQRNSNVEHHYMLFVLSDGENNGGVNERITAQLLVSYGIPVHTIGYELGEAGTEELRRLASYTEGFAISVNEENVIYNMRNMFNSQM